MENSRRSGRTTRIVDQAIQELFKDGKVVVYDHPIPSPSDEYKNTVENNIWVARIVAGRLYNEHGFRTNVDFTIKENVITLLSK